jgi:hypothetical protein
LFWDLVKYLVDVVVVELVEVELMELMLVDMLEEVEVVFVVVYMLEEVEVVFVEVSVLVSGPGFGSTSPAFSSSTAIHKRESVDGKAENPTG